MPHSSRFRAWLRAIGAHLSDRGQKLIRRIPALGIDESTLLIGFAVVIGGAGSWVAQGPSGSVETVK